VSAAFGPRAAPRPGEPEAAPLGRRLALFVAVAALVVGLGWAFWLPAARHAYDYHTRTHGWNWDFRVYYAAGRDWSLGMDPYGDQWTQTVAARIGEVPIRFAHQKTLRFIYPPTLLPLYRALSVVPYRTARAVWLGLNAAALVAAAVVALVLERGRRLEVGAALLLLGLVSYPLLYHIREGNIDMIVAGLGTGGFLLYGRWRSWPTALLLALAIVTKVTPLLIVAALVVYHRDLRLLAKTAGAVAVLVGLSLLAVPLRFYDQAARVLFMRSVGMPGWVDQSVARLLVHAHPTARYVAAAAVTALLVWLLLLGRREAVPGRRAGHAALLADHMGVDLRLGDRARRDAPGRTVAAARRRRAALAGRRPAARKRPDQPPRAPARLAHHARRRRRPGRPAARLRGCDRRRRAVGRAAGRSGPRPTPARLTRRNARCARSPRAGPQPTLARVAAKACGRSRRTAATSSAAVAGRMWTAS
jgi:hypothetical protein